jgi:hypothetical protein
MQSFDGSIAIKVGRDYVLDDRGGIILVRATFYNAKGKRLGDIGNPFGMRPERILEETIKWKERESVRKRA